MKKIKAKINMIIERIALIFVFFLAIGSTHVVMRLFSKKLIKKDHLISDWKNHSSDENCSKMY